MGDAIALVKWERGNESGNIGVHGKMMFILLEYNGITWGVASDVFMHMGWC